MERDSTSTVLFKLIKRLNIPVSQTTVDEELLRHPSYPSLLAISDVLNTWNIPNGAYGVSFDNLSELEFPYLAALNTEEFVIVTNSSNDLFIIDTNDANEKKLTASKFKELYSGSILIAEAESNSGESHYRLIRRKEIVEKFRNPVVIIGLLIIIVSLSINSSFFKVLNLPILLVVCCKSAGILITALLLIQSINKDNPLVQKICNSDKKNNCHGILSSKAAKITPELSWSEVGFFYYSGTWLLILFNSANIGILHIIAILNVLALPYTFYSILYQWRVARQWCIFCCTIQGLLWIELIGLFPYINLKVLPTGWQWLSVAATAAIPVIGWIFLKPLFIYVQQIYPLKQQLRQFKYNDKYFEIALADSPKYALPSEEHTVLLGNRNAKNIITIVSNPYCGPCSTAHEILDAWLSKRDDIKLQVVFTARDGNDAKSKVARHIMGLKANAGDENVRTALNSWYKQSVKNFDDWFIRHPAEYTHDVVSQALKKQYEWCKLAEISKTPTIFINGRRLPQPYHPEDLKYFI